MSRKRIVVLGAGGFAREVEWLIHDINRVREEYEFAGYVVSDLSKLGERDSRDRVAGDEAWLEENAGKTVDCAAIGIGSPAVRLKLASRLKERAPKLAWPALVHPTAQMDARSCKVEEGVIICAENIFTVNILLEAFCMVNLNCTIGHEARVGRGSVLNPDVNLSGGVELGEGVLVGVGGIVLQYVKVGRGATVGAGALVTKDVPEGVTVVGVPAKPLQR